MENLVLYKSFKRKHLSEEKLLEKRELISTYSRKERIMRYTSYVQHLLEPKLMGFYFSTFFSSEDGGRTDSEFLFNILLWLLLFRQFSNCDLLPLCLLCCICILGSDQWQHSFVVLT